MKKAKKIPKFKSDDEAAAFWGAHDFPDYVEDTEPVNDVVFQQKSRGTIGIRLEK